MSNKSQTIFAVCFGLFLSADIRKLQREQDLCQDITFRSAGIEEVVRLIEEPERQKELQQKENEKYESKR